MSQVTHFYDFYGHEKLVCAQFHNRQLDLKLGYDRDPINKPQRRKIVSGSHNNTSCKA